MSSVQFSLQFSDGSITTVKAETVGKFKVHKDINLSNEWAVTNVVTGYKVCPSLLPIRQLARQYAKQLTQAFPTFEATYSYNVDKCKYMFTPEYMPLLVKFATDFYTEYNLPHWKG